MDKRTCAACKFYRADTEGLTTVGWCKQSPPGSIPLEKLLANPCAGYPVVAETTEACGEHCSWGEEHRAQATIPSVADREVRASLKNKIRGMLIHEVGRVAAVHGELSTLVEMLGFSPDSVEADENKSERSV
jgi:hypothetical protein